MIKIERSKDGFDVEAREVIAVLAKLPNVSFEMAEGIVGLLQIPEAAGAVCALESATRWATSEARGLTFDKVETEVVEHRGPEILRLILQAHADSQGNGDVGEAVESADKTGSLVRFTHRRERTRTIQTTVGSVVIRRLTYSRRGEQSIVPQDDRLNLPVRGFSHVLSRKVVTQAARAPYEETGRTVEELTGRHVSVASMLELVSESAVDFDDFYAQRKVSESNSELLVASVDCKGIPMRRETAPKRRRLKRLVRGEKPDKKKMASVSAVYEVDPFQRTADEVLGTTVNGHRPRLARTDRPRPQNKRAWASLDKTKDEMFEQVLEEMQRRDSDRRKVWVCVTDGDPALDTRARKILGADGPLVVVRDIFHVTEYLWKAANAFHREGSEEAGQFVSRYLEKILAGKVSQVARGIRQSATKRGLKGNKRKVVDTVCRYLLRNKHAMRYDEYLRTGLPIASGVVEGACRHLVKDRLERAGMRWTIPGAEAILKMRALEICADTSEYWEYHLKQQHARLYGRRTWKAAFSAA